MALSKETRIKIFIVVDLIFFFIELIIGYSAHSLALVADAFHMLNDVISLCVGLWAVRVATTRSSSNTYTYGWARAEILGGLVNGVFLVALCLSIFLEAIQRFFEPQEVKNPILVLIVGGIGLTFNILGLFVFHQHSHSHSHEESDEAHGAEEGHSHSHEHAHVHDHDAHAVDDNTKPSKASKGNSVSFDAAASRSPQPIERSTSRTTRGSISHSRRPGSRSYDPADMPIYPGSIRDNIISQARMGDDELESDLSSAEDAVETDTPTDPSEQTPLLRNGNTNGKKSGRTSASKRYSNGEVITHQHHNHTTAKPGGKSGGHGHSHDDMNIRGMFLHVLGDALGNVGVMATALIIKLTDPWPYRFYFDPLISLLITAIILKSAIPLCKETSRPLLQAVPEDISLGDIKEDIESLPGVRSCHHLHVWALTPSRRIATLDVALDFDYEVQKYMQLAKEIKRCLHAYGIHSSTIQPEFSEVAGLCQLECGDGNEDAKKCCTPKGGSGTATPHNGSSHSHDSDDRSGHAH